MSKHQSETSDNQNADNVAGELNPIAAIDAEFQ